jgi:hypothetical protein
MAQFQRGYHGVYHGVMERLVRIGHLLATVCTAAILAVIAIRAWRTPLSPVEFVSGAYDQENPRQPHRWLKKTSVLTVRNPCQSQTAVVSLRLHTVRQVLDLNPKGVQVHISGRESIVLNLSESPQAVALTVRDQETFRLSVAAEPLRAPGDPRELAVFFEGWDTRCQ